MEFELRESKGVTIADLSGKVVASQLGATGAEAALMFATVQHLIDPGDASNYVHLVRAPVNAPRSYPKSSASTRLPGSAAQFTLINGLFFRGLFW